MLLNVYFKVSVVFPSTTKMSLPNLHYGCLSKGIIAVIENVKTLALFSYFAGI